MLSVGLGIVVPLAPFVPNAPIPKIANWGPGREITRALPAFVSYGVTATQLPLNRYREAGPGSEFRPPRGREPNPPTSRPPSVPQVQQQ
jgi:hypothetical protein